ncbi:MAG TPA: MMPL family transporter [Thermoleophilaceae bacterium]
MIRLANIAVRRPKTTLIAWLLFFGVLGFIGTRVEHHLSPSILVVKGTESSRAQDIARSRFGNSQLVPILLKGPAAQLDKQGPALVNQLRARHDTRVLSPWDKTGGTEALRPKPTVATIVTAVEQSEKTVANTIQPQIDRTVRANIHAPVTSYVTGQPSIDRALRHEAVYTTRTAVLIALPVVFVLVTLLFGSPMLGALVAAFSGTVLAAGFGLTALVARAIDVDPVALAGAAVLGLALSSAFGLLMIARYREEVGDAAALRDERETATRSAISGTGRTVLLAGTAVVITMIIATMLSTTEILNSVGIGATILAGLAAVAAVGVLPAVLVLGGHRLDKFSFVGLGDRIRAHLPKRVPGGIIKHPAVVGIAAFALLAVLAAPTLGLSSGPPDPKILPKDNTARQNYETVAREMGPGFVTPFEVIVVKKQGTITTRQFLGELARYQKAIAKDPAVASVVGPGVIVSNANQLQGVPQGLNTAAKTAKKSKKDLKTLIAGLGQAGGGVNQLRAGLAAAASGASQLNSGSGQAVSGSAQLHSGLEQALVGANQLKAGSAAAAAGAKDLSGGLGTAEAGVVAGLPVLHSIAGGLSAAANDVSSLANSAKAVNADVSSAAAALDAMTTGKSDPQYPAAAAAVARAQSSSAALAAGLGTAATNVGGSSAAVQAVEQNLIKLRGGLTQLHAGAQQLASGNSQLAGGNAGLAAGLTQLADGAGQLQAGLAQLHSGTGQLASGLSGGYSQSAPLSSGMDTITKAVIHSRATIPSTAALTQLKRQSPRLFDSGYFVLAALQGAPAASRQAAGFTVNVEQGGAAGRITVTPKYGVNDPRTQALGDRLSASAATFARATGTEAAVGGNAASLIQYHDVAASKVPAVIIGISLFTYLLLLTITRSMILPLVAVAINLATAGATFGVLTLLFNGDNPPLGGPGLTDPVTIISIVTVVLGISQVYEVFVLSRARERYDAGHPADASLYGLNHTWAIVTALTVPMLAAALLFTPSLLTIVRELSVGMLVAVLINAIVVRLFLMPATIAMLGRFNWWLPRRLSRFVPRVHFGDGRPAGPPATTIRHKPN